MIFFEYKSNKAAFYFAAEEHIMRDIRPEEPVCLLWQTYDTVMIGANQIANMEIDREYALSHGIDIVRRSSGGGTIFTDPGTLLFTIIIPYNEDMDPKEIAKEYFAIPVIHTLEKLGIAAMPEGRNDIIIDGKKISGIAQYVKYGYLCTHGSLLFNADIEKLFKVLTVDQEKITSKALRSARNRVTNIADYVDSKDITILINGLLEYSLAELQEFDENDLADIRQIMKEKYGSPDWTFGHNPPYTFRNSHRFSGGRIEVCLEIRNGCVNDCRINGDFLSIRPVSEIEELIKGSTYDRKSLLYAISGIKLAEYFGTILKEELVDLLLCDDCEDRIQNG